MPTPAGFDATLSNARIVSVWYRAKWLGILTGDHYGDVGFRAVSHSTGTDLTLTLGSRRIFDWTNWKSPAYEFNNETKGFVLDTPSVRELVSVLTEELAAKVVAEEARLVEAARAKTELDASSFASLLRDAEQRAAAILRDREPGGGA